MKQHYYRDTMYFWMISFTLLTLGVIFCGILLCAGGADSHIFFYGQGYLEGNPAKSIDFETLTWMLYILGGASVVFQVVVFLEERIKINGGFPILSFIILLLLIIGSFLIYRWDLNHTPREIQDEILHYKEIIAAACSVAGIITLSLFNLIACLIYWIPLANELDKSNWEKLTK